jgi:cell division septation protein DedD
VEECLSQGDPELLVFTANQALQRVEKLGDLFEPVLKSKQKLPQLEALDDQQDLQKDVKQEAESRPNAAPVAMKAKLAAVKPKRPSLVARTKTKTKSKSKPRTTSASKAVSSKRDSGSRAR